jgi:L-lactate utilization protein LutC
MDGVSDANQVSQKGKANVGVLSSFMRHWEQQRSEQLRMVDMIPEHSVAAVEAASQWMGTTVEQTFAALRQESEELQRLQVCGHAAGSVRV